MEIISRRMVRAKRPAAAKLKHFIRRIKHRIADAEQMGWKALAASWREDLEFLENQPR